MLKRLAPIRKRIPAPIKKVLRPVVRAAQGLIVRGAQRLVGCPAVFIPTEGYQYAVNAGGRQKPLTGSSDDTLLQNVDEQLILIRKLLAESKTHYDGSHGTTATPQQVAHAAEIATNALGAMLRCVPPSAQTNILSEILADVEAHPNELLFGESLPRPWNGEGALFDAAVAERVEPLRDGRAIHLELGCHTSWPTSEVEQYRQRHQLGDVIRLDMNPEFPIDVAASVTALPFADETIDRIYSTSLFEHVAYPNEIIVEAFRILRPGGVLVAAVPFHFTEHRVPCDYLRFTGQFFEDVCSVAGFKKIVTDIKSGSGAYYTAHRLMKSAVAVEPQSHEAATAALTAHLAVLALTGCLRSLDRLFHSGSASLFTWTRAVAVKPSYNRKLWMGEKAAYS